VPIGAYKVLGDNSSTGATYNDNDGAIDDDFMNELTPEY